APIVAAVAQVIQPRPEPAQSRWPIDFVATTPEVALFPRHLWTRAMERALRDAPDATLDYADHRGSLALRQAVSGYLARVRGVRIDAFVIEDDYDPEFRFDRQPVGALQGLDPARVIHLGTASKTLAPGIRLGWMSVPAALVEDLRREKGEADSGSPSIDQLAL